METTIKTWIAIESNSFKNFNEVLAVRFETGIFKSVAMKLWNALHSNGKAEVTVPWGTYRAEIKSKGETGNINVQWEPSIGFIKLLNGDMEDDAARACIDQDEFDPEFVELFRDYVAYGFFYPNAPENKDRVPANKGVRLKDDEVKYFLNDYALVLATIAKDKQRDGKVTRLEINNGFSHGYFDFEYDDDEIKVTWTADKVFKQFLKNDDAAAAKAIDHDYTPIKETRIDVIPLDAD